MKYNNIRLLCLVFFMIPFIIEAQYVNDVLGDDFLQQQITMPSDYEGKVVTTLVRKTSGMGANEAVLYIHGFNDYFFQKETASFFTNHCYNFYAVDLRKCGRSWMPHQKKGNVYNLNEYFADIDSALFRIRQEGNQSVLLLGHSMGGLVASLYLDKTDRLGKDSSFIKGLILNSPFLDMNMSWFNEKIGVPLLSVWGKMSPKSTISHSDNALYANSIHAKYKGEWEYDLKWKLLKNKQLSAGFIYAIHSGQSQLKRGLHITQPVLVLHSSMSVSGTTWNEDFTRGDAVLDVNDIHKYATRLGNHVSVMVVQDGLHDLALSKKAARTSYYSLMERWMSKNIKRNYLSDEK